MSADKSKAAKFTAAELKCIASLVEKEQKKLTGASSKIPEGFHEISLSLVIDGSLTKGQDSEVTARFPESTFWKMMYKMATDQQNPAAKQMRAERIFKELSNPKEKAAALENEITDALRLESAVRELWKANGPKDARAGQSQVVGVIKKSEA